MITAKRKKLKEKEKRARERVRKIKAKRVKAKEKAKKVKVKRKKLKEKEKRARERVRKIKAKRVKAKEKAKKVKVKRKKLKEKEKRARERVRKIKAKRVKAKEKAKKVRVRRKELRKKARRIRIQIGRDRKQAGRRAVKKYRLHKDESSYLDGVLKQRALEKILGNDKGKIYKNEKLKYGTQEEKDQIDRNRKHAADDAADTRKRNAAKKGKLGTRVTKKKAPTSDRRFGKYKNKWLIFGTQEEKDQIDRNRKQAADDAADTRKRNAAKKGKLRR